MNLGSSALKNAGHKVYMLHSEEKWQIDREIYSGELVLPPLFDRRSYSDPSQLPVSLQKVRTFVKDFNIDVLHVQGWPRTSALSQLISELPVVATTHVALCPNSSRYMWKERSVCDRSIGAGCFTTGYMKCGCGYLGNGRPYSVPAFLRSMYEDNLFRRTLAKCACIIAPSGWIKRRLSADGFDKSMVTVLQPPIAGLEDDSFEKQDRVETPDVPVILYVGRLTDFKGPDQVLRASSMIKQNHVVWMIGEGPTKANLEELAESLGIASRVKFLGSMNPEEINKYRRVSTVVAVPSLWPDNFPMVGPEAMLVRKPVVAYNVGGISEWLSDGETGRLIPAKDVTAFASALEQIISDPAMAKQMGDRALEKASQWSPEKHGARLEKIYESAISIKMIGDKSC